MAMNPPHATEKNQAHRLKMQRLSHAEQQLAEANHQQI
jgi:hypothetical protein